METVGLDTQGQKRAKPPEALAARAAGCAGGKVLGVERVAEAGHGHHNGFHYEAKRHSAEGEPQRLEFGHVDRMPYLEGGLEEGNGFKTSCQGRGRITTCNAIIYRPSSVINLIKSNISSP